MTNFFTRLFSGGAAKLIGGIGKILDDLTTTKEEKLDAERKIKKLLLQHEKDMEQQITDRWKYDMESDNWLSKSVRPLVLIFLVVSTILLIFIDAGVISFTVEEKWTDLLQIVLLTVIAAYFGSRGMEKIKKNR